MLWIILLGLLRSLAGGDDGSSWILTDAGFYDGFPAVKAPDVTAPQVEIEAFYKNHVKNFKSRGSDGEHVDALHHFFYNVMNGTSLELGAVDGWRLSETKAFSTSFGWRRILIEANPSNNVTLKKYTNTFAVNAAICESESGTRHFINQQGHKMESGLLEYFDDDSVKRLAPDLLKYKIKRTKKSTTATPHMLEFDWEKVKHDYKDSANGPPWSIDEVACVTVRSVLSRARVNHVNFAVIDTEGSELGVLGSIDFAAVRFDVIVVETETANNVRPGEFPALVEGFLGGKGYSKVVPGGCGRNSWFLRQGFVPSRAPWVKVGCFNGAIEACKMRAMHAEADKFQKSC
jgi:hypothetical protein